jgi:hypothetical protein
MRNRILRRWLALLVCLMLFGSGAALAETINAFNGDREEGTDYWAYDTNGTTKLEILDVVQLLSTTGTPQPPTASGEATGGDVILQTTVITGEAGQFFATASVPAGTKVYVRVWNSSAIGPGSYYDESAVFTVYESPTLPVDWYVAENLITTKVYAIPASTSPSSRGQGAQSQIVTVEGDYFQSGANVAFSGGSGLTENSTTWLDINNIKMVISLGTSATVGPWDVTVTNPGVPVSEQTATFTVNAGPHPGAPSPGSLYRGDSSKTVTIEGTGFHSNATVVFSGNSGGEIVYSTSWVDATKLELTGFDIKPSAAASGRTVTVTNPDDAGRDTTTFTVNDPWITNVNPSSGYRGNTFEVTVSANGTHFNDGTTGIQLGSQPDYVKTSNLTINSPTSLTFDLVVSPEASTGGQTLTVTTTNVVSGESEVENLAGAFTINAPTLGTPSPSSLYRGDIAVISASGTGTHFDQANTSVTFETAGIEVTNVTVESATALQFTAAVPTSVSAGGKTLYVRTTAVQNGTEQVTNTLTINVPSLGTLNPNQGDLGGAYDVAIPGTGTHFRTGETTVLFSGSGVTVNYVTVESATALTAGITIDAGAATGARNVTAQTTNLDAGGTETVTKTSAFTINTPTAPGQVTYLRALAEPQLGSITMRWSNPPANYSGGRMVYTNTFANWDSLTKDSPEPIDEPGVDSGVTTREITALTTGEVYYFQVFSYKESGGAKFFNTSGVKVAAVPMGVGGEVLPLSHILTFETGAHGINHYSMPFPSPWFIFDTGDNPVTFTNFGGQSTNEVENAYDMVKAINAEAGSNIVSTFAKWLGPNITPEAEGIKIGGNDPEPVKSTLGAITLENGVSYQVYLTAPVTLKIKNTL